MLGRLHLAFVLIIVLLGGCTTLPPGSDFPRSESRALAHPEETRLGRQFGGGEPGGKSGFRIIPVGADGFLMRMQMIHAAQRTLAPGEAGRDPLRIDAGNEAFERLARARVALLIGFRRGHRLVLQRLIGWPATMAARAAMPRRAGRARILAILRPMPRQLGDTASRLAAAAFPGQG